MICPSCGAESTGTKFCENCGCSLPTEFEPTTPIAQPTEPVAQPTEPVAEPTTPIEQPTEPMAGSFVAEVPGDSAWQAQPQQAYQTEPTLQMPPQQNASAYTPPQQNASAYTPTQSNAGGYVPPAGGPQAPSQQYQQPGAYKTVPAGNQAPSAAFVLVIVGLILSVLFVTFVPGVVCSIIGLVLNSSYNKKGLNNPRKTSTMVLGIIGIVVAVLCLVTTVIIGVLTAQVVDELDKQGIDITKDSVEVSTDSSGNINITVNGSSASSAASGQSTTDSSSAAASSDVSSTTSSTTSSSAYADDKYHDNNWNPTLYSVVELTGAEMSDLLESYNFSWDDGFVGWAANDGSCFAVSSAAGELSKSKIEALPKGAAGQAVAIGLWVEGYSTPAAALKALGTGIVTEKTYEVDSETSFAIVSSSSKVRYLIVVSESAVDEQMFLLFTEEAITSGYLTSLLGHDLGSSIDEVWNTIASDSKSSGSIG